MSTTPFPSMPGAGAMTDSLEFVKNLWGSMGVPGMSIPSMAAPAMTVEDLDKKIADLKAVEAWLNVNGAMLRATIQGLEVQRGTLATLKTMSASFADAMKTLTPDPTAKPAAAAAPAMPAMPDPTIWWNMLQDQFKQAVASAVPATPFGGTGGTGGTGGSGSAGGSSSTGAASDASTPATPVAGADEIAPPRSARKNAKS